MANKPRGRTGKTKADANYQAYVRARDAGHTDYLREAVKFNQYYVGEQWDESDRQKLEGEGRPALTINQVLPTINTVLGEQAANRAVVKLKPMRNATYADAMMLEKLVAHIFEENDYASNESEVFADGIISDRGYFDVRMNFDTNRMGDIDITIEDPFDIVLDPDAKEYDTSTWKEVIKTRWMSITDIEAEYGEDAAKSITGHLRAMEDFDPDAFELRENTFGESHRTGRIVVDGDREVEVRSVRVVERQHKMYNKKCRYFYTQFGDYFQVPDYMDAETADMFAVTHGYQIIERAGFKIRWTVSAGEDILLFDDWSPYPWFTIVPYFPYFRRGRPFGMVRNIMSPQDQLNKLSSQELHIVNTTANSGWIIEENSLGDGLTLADIERKGAQTGFVMSYKQGRQAPEKIQANQIPTGIDRLSQKAQMFIHDISGISAPMQGAGSPYTSSKALRDQIQRSQVQIQKPIDNLAKTRRMVAERVLYLIQAYYTEERVFHVGTDLEPGVTDEEITINQETAEGIANDVTVGKYKVVITQQPAIDNYQDAQRQELLEMRQMGIMIPDHLIVKYSNLQDRDELVEIMKRMAGLHEPTQEEQELAEFQQQAMIQSIQYDLAMKEAEIADLMAKTDLNNAKVASELDPDAIQNVLKIIDLQQDMKKNLDNLNARLRMSHMAQQAALQRSGVQSMVQVRGQDVQQETTLAQSAMALQSARETAESRSKPDSE